jgi:hypothetical protein
MAHNTTVDILSLGGRVKCQDKPQIVLDHPIESVYDGSAPAGNVNAGNRNSDNPNVGKTEVRIKFTWQLDHSDIG